MKSFAKFTARLFLLLLIALAGAVIYLDVRGFPPKLQAIVEHQLLRAGYAVQFGRIRLDVLRGVVARDALVADAKAPSYTLAQIDEVELQWNWQRMLRGENALGAIRIANAQISVPTPPDEIGPETFTAHEAYATFRFLDDGTTAIEQLSGVYCGIRVQVSGRIKPRSASEAEPARRPAEGERSPFAFVTKVLRELNNLRVTQPPQLDFDFDADLARPLDSRAHARLIGTEFRYRNLQLQRASVDVAMNAGAIEFREFRVQLADGEASVQGRYDIAMGRFDLLLKSTLDPSLVAAALPEKLARGVRELRVERNPVIEARYVLSPETGSLPLLTGTVNTGGLEIRGVSFRAISFAFENQGRQVKIADARILTREGRLTGHGQIQMERPWSFSYELDSTLNPRKLLPLMTPVMHQIVEPSWFETPPHIVASVTGDFVDPDAFGYDAELKTGRCSYRGVALTGVSATLQLRRSRLDVPQMVLARDEGQLRGSLLADFKNHQVSFDIETTANPSEMAPLLGPKSAELMRAYRFGPRTTATARGLVDFNEPGNSAWTARVANEGFSYWKLSADRATADLALTNNVLTIANFEADFYDGKLTGAATFSLTNAPTYQFDFATDRVDVNKLLTAVRGKEGSTTGLLSGKCALQGEGSDLAQLRGAGNLIVTDGVLGELGLFGIFSRILNEIGPGLGSTKLTSATASFKVEDNAVKTDDLKIAAGAYSLSSHGKITFDCKLDFRVNGQLLKALPGVNIITWFLSHVFEYKIGGTCSSPTYRPTNLPKEFMPHSPDVPDKAKDKPAETPANAN